MNSNVLVGVLLFAIVTCVGLILVWVKRFFYKTRSYGTVTTSQRALAFFFDFLFLHLFVVFSYIVWGLSNGVLGDQITQYIILVKEVGTSRFWYDVRFVQFYMLVLYCTYAFVGEALFSTTLGKKMLGIKVLWQEGRWLVVARNLVKLPSLLLWPVGLLFSVCNAKRKWGHDYISKSVLARVEADN